jgi:hypothetical protein
MINTAAGAKLLIATTPGIPANLAAYQALTWTEVGEVEDLGEFGDESDSVSFTALADARTRKMKGPRDAGTMAIVVGDDMLDDGQIAMEAAEATNINWPFQIQLNDAITVGGDDSTHFFSGMVMSKRRNVGNVSNVVRRNFSVAVNTAILSTDPS